MPHPQTYRIDDKVIYTMLFISIICLFFMAFRYKNREQCKPFDFSYQTANKQDVAFSNERIFFSAAANNVKDWRWDFGDKSSINTTSGPFVEHIYKQPGSYTVRLTINGNCEEVKTISVNSRETQGKKFVMRVQWPAEPLYAGREYYFIDSTDGASTWGWYVDDEPKRSRQSLAYQFLEPGQHTIALVLNDDPENNKVMRNFNVLPSQNVAASVTPKINQQNRRSGPPVNNDIQNETSSKPLGDYIDGGGTTNTTKAPALSDTRLKAAVLNIGGNGYSEIRGFLQNNSFANCTILFNSKPISADQLKENIKMHFEYGKSLTAKQETDPNGYIKVIDIVAELSPKGKFLGLGGKERKYPH